MKKTLTLFLVLAAIWVDNFTVSAQTKILRTPDERFQNLPEYNFKPNYVEIEKGLRMHYVDEGNNKKSVIVLLHGQPSWSYLYRKMIPVLAKENRVIAPDMIGYGRSDKLASMDDYTYARHIEWMTKFFEKMKFKNVTLVVHDWGGLIGLRVLANHPDWFKKIVVLNTSYNIGEDYAGFTDRYKDGLKRWEDYLATAKDIKFGGAIQANTLRTLTPAESAAYDAPYGNDPLTMGPRRMTVLIPLKPDRPGVAENIATEKILREWKKPVFIAFSEDSEKVHPKQHQRFRDIFAKSEMWADISVPGSKHFLQEDKGAELAVLVNAFVAGKKYSPEMMSIFGATAPAQTSSTIPVSLKNGNPKSHNIDDAKINELREILKKSVADGTAPGISLLIAHKNEIIFKESAGNLEVNKTAFIASTTKPITAATVLTVVDEGKLNLDDKISKYLPEFVGTKVENATIRQLLSHNSGIKGDYPGGRPKTGTLAEFSKMIAKNGTLNDPGTFSYSGVGMDIAARVAEVASGKNFEELLKTRILDPLEMKNTSYRLAADPASVKPGEGRYISGGGGLDSTLDDLAAFFQMQYNGGTYNGKRILSEKLVNEMHTKQTVSAGAPTVFGEGYGLGLTLNRLTGKDNAALTYGHSGSLGTVAWIDADRDLVGIFFTQVSLAKAVPIFKEVQQKVREMIPAKQ